MLVKILYHHCYVNCLILCLKAVYILKVGVVVPIPKKGDKTDVDNYRGVTLTSIFSKIFSHVLDLRFVNMLKIMTI